MHIGIYVSIVTFPVQTMEHTGFHQTCLLMLSEAENSFTSIGL